MFIFFYSTLDVEYYINRKWAYIVIDVGLKGFEPSTYRL
jgi:hypothetical protein